MTAPNPNPRTPEEWVTLFYDKLVDPNRQILRVDELVRQAMQQARREGMREAFDEAAAAAKLDSVVMWEPDGDRIADAIRARRDELLGETE